MTNLMNGYTHTKTYSDCGIVAISNLLGIPYERVWDTAQRTGYLIRSNGLTTTGKLNSCLQELGYRAVELPKDFIERRKFTGLYRYHKSTKDTGHIVPCVCGHVYDYDGSIKPLVKKGRAPKYETYIVVIKDTETGV